MSSASPHRSAALVTRCTSCEENATSGCLRCGRPQCDAHATSGEVRCGPCEADWRHRELAITRITPAKLGGLRAYGTTVLIPSFAVASCVGLMIALGGLIGGAPAAGFILGGQAWLAFFVAMTIILTAPFVAIGVPLLARRKVVELAQLVRYGRARRRFLEERAIKALQDLGPAQPLR